MVNKREGRIEALKKEDQKMEEQEEEKGNRRKRMRSYGKVKKEH